MQIKSIDTYELPAFWAPYLINGDASGMYAEEIKQCDEYTATLGQCTEVGHETYFGRFKGEGNTLAVFTFVRYEEGI